jgi:hypothetical protein
MLRRKRILQAYVLSVRCFRDMLQVFRMDVAKVDWNVTYVAMAVHVCCTPIFISFFRHMLQVCLSECCIYFTHMLQVFYLDVVYVCNDFQVFSGVFC